MFIETTININNDCLNKISNAARISGKSRTEIVRLLLKELMDAKNYHIQCGRRVRYQNRSQANNWHTLHVQFRPDDYEYFLDLRKLLKMSLSLILSIAVEKYIKKLMQKKNTDNYHFQNYVLLGRDVDGIIQWTLIWGYPPNIEAYLSQSPRKKPPQ